MAKTIMPLNITASSAVNATGCGKQALLTAIQNNNSGLKKINYPNVDFDTWFGHVDAVETIELEPDLMRYDCRNNRLAKLALDTDGFRGKIMSAIECYGADRIGVFLGTSTSGKAETERAYQQQDSNGALPSDFDIMHTHNMASVLHYVQHSLGLNSVGISISTACSSSAKVFATAHRYINAGLCDAAIVGGVDSLCLTTFYGFRSLQLVSSEPCRPWDVARNGINIGEAAGFALLEKQEISNSNTNSISPTKKYVKLKGFGESSDAYHMSTPDKEGWGAKKAMEEAMQRAGLQSTEIDYINLHGTATPSNDAAESQGLVRTFSETVACSSTKGYTGHTLGAAGITEAIICTLVLEHDILPGTVNLQNPDPALPISVLRLTENRSVNNVMSNSFGFGGSNCSLVFGW